MKHIKKFNESFFKDLKFDLMGSETYNPNWPKELQDLAPLALRKVKKLYKFDILPKDVKVVSKNSTSSSGFIISIAPKGYKGTAKYLKSIDGKNWIVKSLDNKEEKFNDLDSALYALKNSI